MLLDQNYFPHNPSNEFIVRAEYASLHHSAKKSAGRRAECAFLAHSASGDPFCRVVECASFAHSANGYAAYQKRRSETAPGSRHTKFLGQSHSDLQKIQIIPRKMVVWRNAPLFTTPPKKALVVGRNAPLFTTPPKKALVVGRNAPLLRTPPMDTLPTKSVGVRLRLAHAMPKFWDSLIPTYKKFISFPVRWSCGGMRLSSPLRQKKRGS